MNAFTFNDTLRKICTFKHNYNCDPQAIINALTILFLLEYNPIAESNAFCENNFEGVPPPVNNIALVLYNNKSNTDFELIFQDNAIVIYVEDEGYISSLDDALVFISERFSID